MIPRFRFYDKKLKKMVYPVSGNFGIDAATGRLFQTNTNQLGLREYFNDPLMQSTGLTDKNNKGLFIGDIVEQWVSAPYDENVPVKITLVIEQRECGCAWLDDRTIGENSGFAHDFISYDGKLPVEYRGNIHDNPELLETE